jgi:prolyl-tRNA editing enzyme YbaK/EbsC (Cys-tRNA(Pro) deacylase)
MRPVGSGIVSGVDRFLEASAALGHAVEVRRFPEGTKTAPDAARAVGCDVAQIVKSLVFIVDGTPVLVLTSGANRVDVDRLVGILGAAEVRRASPDEVRSTTGFAIGGTPPFGHPASVRTVVDRDLLGHDVVWAAAGAPDAVFGTTPEELVATSGGQVADVRET